jgi:hypothetical protein
MLLLPPTKSLPLKTPLVFVVQKSKRSSFMPAPSGFGR